MLKCEVCSNQLTETECFKTGEFIESYTMLCEHCRMYCITYAEGTTEIGIGEMEKDFFFTIHYPYNVKNKDLNEVTKKIAEIVKLFVNKIPQEA